MSFRNFSFGSGEGGASSTPPPQPPQMPKLSRRQIIFMAVVALIVVVVMLFRGAATLYTDYLWFRSVGLSSVWTNLLTTKILLVLLAVAVMSALAWLNLWLLERLAPRVVSTGPRLAGEDLLTQFRELPKRIRFWVRTALAVAVGGFTGLGFYLHWSEWLLFLNGGSVGTKDPLYGMDIGFFMFKLPFLTTAVNWFFGMFIMVIFLTIVGHVLTGALGIRANRFYLTTGARVHIAILAGIFALIRAAQYWLERLALNFSTRSDQVGMGANYTDAKFVMPALLMLVFISIIAAIAFFASARLKSLALPATTVVVWGLVSLVIGTVLPAGVQRLVVKPAEATKEITYLQRNIDATRAAMGIDKVTVHDYDYQPRLEAADITENTQTIRNLRLWETEVAKPSYQRLQESRSFFNFNDIDVDRYIINGRPTQVMLSVRELNSSQLPADRRSWVNERLQYTHGYGAVVSPANAVTPDGKPDFTLKDVPPVGSPEITRPQVYFGEKATPGSYVIARSGQPEIDYVSSSGRDETSIYEGKGGVPLDNLFKRAAFAARVGEIEPLISSSVGKDSRAMYITNISARVKEAAPFLSFDADPYPVIHGGRILWVQDAYTTSSWYPYGTNADTSNVDGASGLKGQRFNYVRNSVKVVTDAYDGDMTFYVVDQTDPVIKAWQKAFPKLFTDGAEMSPELRAHMRYPEDLFRVQTQMYGQYHMTDAKTFYTKSDRWNIAQEPPRSPQAPTPGTSVVDGQMVSTGENRIQPYYLMMKAPNDTTENFMLFQPFVPYSTNDQRKELSGFMTAKGDPDGYGQLDVFAMPRDQQIDGPSLVDARINSEPTLARQIALLNQQGSRVIYGDLLIVPINSSLVYVRPLYVEAQNTKIPELKSVIVVHGDKIAMESTLSRALGDVFGTAPETLEKTAIDENFSTGGAVSSPNTGSGGDTSATNGGTAGSTSDGATPATPTAPSGPADGTTKEFLDRAKSEFDAADQALRNGDLAVYQRHVRAGAALVEQARSRP